MNYTTVELTLGHTMDKHEKNYLFIRKLDICCHKQIKMVDSIINVYF